MNRMKNKNSLRFGSMQVASITLCMSAVSMLMTTSEALGAASGCIPGASGQPPSEVAQVTKINSIQQGSDYQGSDYVVVCGPGRIGTTALPVVSVAFYVGAFVQAGNKDSSSVALGTSASSASVDALRIRGARLSESCLDMAKQAMATGRGFMLTAIKNDSSGAIRAKLVDQGDSCLFATVATASSTAVDYIPPRACQIK